MGVYQLLNDENCIRCKNDTYPCEHWSKKPKSKKLHTHLHIILIYVVRCLVIGIKFIWNCQFENCHLAFPSLILRCVFAAGNNSKLWLLASLDCTRSSLLLHKPTHDECLFPTSRRHNDVCLIARLKYPAASQPVRVQKPQIIASCSNTFCARASRHVPHTQSWMDNNHCHYDHYSFAIICIQRCELSAAIHYYIRAEYFMMW